MKFNFNLDYLSILAEQNYHITLITTIPSHHPWHEHFYRITPEIFHLPNFLETHQWLAFTKYLIQSRSIDLVLISNSYMAYYFLPFLTREFPDVAFVDLIHTTDPGWRGNGYPRVSCQFHSYLDAQIVTSQFLANEYQRIRERSQQQKRDYFPSLNYPPSGHTAYLAVGGMNPSLAENLEDYECWIHLCERGWLGVIIPELHYFYRIRSDSRLQRISM